MKARFIKHVAALVAASALAAPAFAGQETFTLAWSGASFGNGATATGQITLDTDLFAVGGTLLPSADVPAFSITISGASTGNGTFELSDFGSMNVSSPSALDFSQQLVGQSLTDGSTWGNTGEGVGGDFNFFANNQSAPNGTWWFTLTTEDGQGDPMLLTSMTAAVPEASNLALMLAGLGLVGFVARRRKAQA